MSLGTRAAGCGVTVVKLCALVNLGRSGGRSGGRSVGRFSHIEKYSYFWETVKNYKLAFARNEKENEKKKTMHKSQGVGLAPCRLHHHRPP